MFVLIERSLIRQLYKKKFMYDVSARKVNGHVCML